MITKDDPFFWNIVYCFLYTMTNLWIYNNNHYIMCNPLVLWISLSLIMSEVLERVNKVSWKVSSWRKWKVLIGSEFGSQKLEWQRHKLNMLTTQYLNKNPARLILLHNMELLLIIIKYCLKIRYNFSTMWHIRKRL